MTDDVFRIEHIGFITKEDNHKLVDVLHDMNKIGLL